jgi:hypothetical protein
LGSSPCKHSRFARRPRTRPRRPGHRWKAEVGSPRLQAPKAQPRPPATHHDPKRVQLPCPLAMHRAPCSTTHSTGELARQGGTGAGISRFPGMGHRMAVRERQIRAPDRERNRSWDGKRSHPRLLGHHNTAPLERHKNQRWSNIREHEDQGSLHWGSRQSRRPVHNRRRWRQNVGAASHPGVRRWPRQPQTYGSVMVSVPGKCGGERPIRHTGCSRK